MPNESSLTQSKFDFPRVLVTGGAGFLGSHLCDRLVAKGHDILCVDSIFNTYGPRMHPNDGRVVSNFAVQALRGKDITIYGDGQQTRSFCHVDDLITGMLQMMETESSFIGPVNLGNPNEVTMLELAETILTLTKSRSKLIFQPLPPDDPRQRRPDISLAKSKLDWQPTISLADGLN